MKYALSLPNGGECGEPRKLAEFARIAEESGWDAVFLEDYIIWQGHNDVPAYDPWVSLAAMAAATKTVRLGTMVTPIPRRRPWKLAREAATLDHLSGGRVILGVGLGDTELDTSFTRFGEETAAGRRARMADEALQLIADLWSGREVEHHGEFYTVAGVRMLPPPVQKPRIPIWIGGRWPLKGPIARALRWDGAVLYKGAPDEDFTTEDYRALARLARARPNAAAPFDICGGRAAWAENSDQEKERAYVASLAEAGMTWWSVYIPPDTEVKMRRRIEAGPLRIG
jgi:alkanesulfonate monooxygenase SsuD/methylene tetrahydromethanopterin reductase-like flavin-dependent oxidoreductase (luciferase family)